MSNSTGDLGSGICLMCLCLLVPLIVGSVIGWLLRGRSDRLGIPWVFLPGTIKRFWEVVTKDDD